MRKINFLTKLKNKGKLEIVEPSEEIKQSYLEKSESYLGSAKILLRTNHLEESVSMTYYNMYYAVMALLFRIGIKCENHSASIILLKELFDIDNSKISFAKKERIDKQDYIEFHITKEETKNIIQIAEEFSAKIIDFISKLNNEKIETYRKKIRIII